MKLFREARLESNYKSVSMWTYRLRSERVPKSYFDKPPVSYDADRRTSGFVEWAFWMVGLESFGKSVVPEVRVWVGGSVGRCTGARVRVCGFFFHLEDPGQYQRFF